MTSSIGGKVVGWLFLAGALMLWAGWAFLPVKLGVFFEPGDFAAVHEVFRPWIWAFRVHIFGFLVTVMALVALGAATVESEARILLWPGLAVAIGGLLVGALADAFYYHHGAWGALLTAEYSQAELEAHVAALFLDTEYVTCLERFSRVFFGLGQVVFAVGLWKWRILPPAIAWSAIGLGVAAMAVTMAFPDNLEYYAPVFHLNCLWFALVGFVALRSGLGAVAEG